MYTGNVYFSAKINHLTLYMCFFTKVSHPIQHSEFKPTTSAKAKPDHTQDTGHDVVYQSLDSTSLPVGFR